MLLGLSSKPFVELNQAVVQADFRLCIDITYSMEKSPYSADGEI